MILKLITINNNDISRYTFFSKIAWILIVNIRVGLEVMATNMYSTLQRHPKNTISSLDFSLV